MKKATAKLAIAITAATFSTLVYAEEWDMMENSDLVIRGGLGLVGALSSNVSSKHSDFNGFENTFSPSLTGTVSVAWIINDQFGIQLGATSPTALTSKLKKGPINLDFFKSNYQQTSLTAQYYFTEVDSFRPYVGLGVAYNHFNPKLGSDKAIPQCDGYKIKGKFTALGEVGVDYRIDSNWIVNASVSYTQGKFNDNLNKIDENVPSTTYNIRPIIGKVNVGYQF